MIPWKLVCLCNFVVFLVSLSVFLLFGIGCLVAGCGCFYYGRVWMGVLVFAFNDLKVSYLFVVFVLNLCLLLVIIYWLGVLRLVY